MRASISGLPCPPGRKAVVVLAMCASKKAMTCVRMVDGNDFMLIVSSVFL